MACFHPLRGYRSRFRNPSGKRSLVFSKSDGYADLPVSVPCGQCIGCRLERTRQWAMRIMHEASLHDENCFVTLTYDDEHLPDYGTLEVDAFPKFVRSLRKRTGAKLRYYQCGEYGSCTNRPHYHGVLFGYDFPDKRAFTHRGDHPTYVSELCGAAWSKGLHEIGSVTFESAAYVASYCTKKLRRDGPDVVFGETGEVVEMVPEHSTMSRRPGIGSDWFEKYADEVYASDSVVVNGKEVKPPKYYDLKLEARDPRWMRRVARARERQRNEDEETLERLAVREDVMYSKYDLYYREAL